MGRTAWTFSDTPDIELEINPSTDNGSLDVTKNIVYSNTGAPGGKTIIYERGQNQPRVNFSGYVYTETQLNTLTAEVNKTTSIMTDDRGIVYNIKWTNFTTSRVRSSKYPWRHNYELQGIVTSHTIP